MTHRIFASALFAGLAAGLIATLLQFAFLTQVLLEGEAYETGAKVHFAGTAPEAVMPAHDHAAAAPAEAAHEHAGHSHDDVDSGLMRHAMTFFTNLVVYTGFALILVGGFALADKAGHAVTLRGGLVWGVAAFVAVQLSPAAGLPPELPGTVAADLSARVIWWVATVAATAAGLTLTGFARTLPLAVAGVLLIAAPHIWGAPKVDTFQGVAPPELSALFAARSLAVGAAAWALLGAVAGYFWNRPAKA